MAIAFFSLFKRLLGLGLYVYDIISKCIFTFITDHLYSYYSLFTAHNTLPILQNRNSFLGDVLVSLEKLNDGHVVWGTTIISLMFLPNLVFVIWMILGSHRRMWHRDTCLRLVAGGSIQCVTLFRYANFKIETVFLL